MISLRRRLFVMLLAATSTIWLTAVIWIFAVSRGELEHVLDTRLREAASMVHSLVGSGNMTDAAGAVPFPDGGYERQLSCQIWSLDGRLLARSSGAPDQNLSDRAEGFSDRMVDGERWRVYTVNDPEKGVRVAVGDRIGLRDRLVRDLVTGLLAPAALIVPLLGLLIWLGLGRGLAPLKAVAGDIEARDGEDMRPVETESAPTEVRPLLVALNGLFGKVEAARLHEREITAFAAHELRTPLAGLKTQAQIALAAKDTDVREAALGQILVSVNRTSRLVRQLLALSRLDAGAEPQATESIDAGAVLREIIHRHPAPPGVTVSLDASLDGLRIMADPDSLDLVLRNLHENAIEHMGPQGEIRWRALPAGAGLSIEDNGPGIPAEEMPHVTQRFYRGRHRSAAGTGLGLTIATMAAGRIGARLNLANREQGGLLVRIEWTRTGPERLCRSPASENQGDRP